MKLTATILSIVLGVLMALQAAAFLAGMMPPPPKDLPVLLQQFMGVMMPSHYIDLVKVCELLGGVFLAVPKTRNLGILFLMPIAVNIAAVDIFLSKAPPIAGGILIVILGFIAWTERPKFLALLR